MSRDLELIDRDGYVHFIKIPNKAFATCPEEHHTSFAEEYTADSGGNIAATAIITPTSGKKLSVHLFRVETDGTSGLVQLDYVTSSKKVARLYAARGNATSVTQTHDEGAVDEVLTLQATGIGNASKVFVKVQYIQED